MTQIDVTVDWKLTTDTGELATEEIEEIMDDDDIISVRIIADCDYAEFVEFGSRPYSGDRRVVPGTSDAPREPTEVNKKFREWAAVKLAGEAASKGTTTDRLGDQVYHAIMTKGCDPHPFLRPALYDVLDEMGEDYLNDGGSPLLLASDIVDRARENLSDLQLIYTGELQRSLRVDIGFNENESLPEDGLGEEVWKSRELGVEVNGVNKRADSARRRL